MKTRKKMLIAAGVVAIVSIGLVIGGWGMVAAGGPWSGSGFPFHGRCGGGSNFKTHGPEMVEFVFWRMDREAAALNLSDLQQQKYEDWKGSIKDHVSQGAASHHQWMIGFQSELNQPEPDVPMLLGTIRTKLNDMAGFANQNLDLFEALWESLDSDQRQILIEHIREKADQHYSKGFPADGDNPESPLPENG